MYDLIIVGAGPAGITASVYAARKKMNFLVISNDIGGQTAWSGKVENYTGYQFISGPDLAAKFEDHMKKYAFNLKENETVLELKKIDNGISIKTNKAKYETKIAIIASGTRSRELNVPGEKEFKNRGITYCATCDGPLFAGKDVAVIGGGNSALDAVLQLEKIAKHVYLINLAPALTGDAIMQAKIAGSKNVTILNSTEVKTIHGNKMVNAIEVVPSSGEKTVRKIDVQGVFIEIGLMPNSDFAEGLEKNKKGEIKVNARNQTSVDSIFAAGDVTDVPSKQIIVAAGEGAKASIEAFKYLSRQK
ncbi:MAG: FAD-dependent oxidoreductase [Candidatus Omnitrophica bacterium]|nr:FAD-dependent oxidoreductase [Candidatus Omnitrophota bacterium]